MELDEKGKAFIKEAVMPIVVSTLASGVVGAVVAEISKYLATSYEQKTLVGDQEIKPTDDNVTMSKTEASAKDNDASLAKDEVKAKDGDLAAMQTDAAASTNEAKALNSGATAAKPVAGALDIKSKGLVMS
jgi:hypothetical protein